MPQAAQQPTIASLTSCFISPVPPKVPFAPFSPPPHTLHPLQGLQALSSHPSRCPRTPPHTAPAYPYRSCRLLSTVAPQQPSASLKSSPPSLPSPHCPPPRLDHGTNGPYLPSGCRLQGSALLKASTPPPLPAPSPSPHPLPLRLCHGTV